MNVSKSGKLFFESKPKKPDDGMSFECFNKKLNGFLHNVFTALKKRARLDDFLSVMESLSNGVLPASNLALNLLLDVGRFLGQETVHTMRYNQGDANKLLLI